ncbi:MAG: UDP-N-acetylglucosamine 2-epimerase [Sedimentibacter sp.]|uniref:UDP-N-acetylglucosamine 2-epimerase n=1 Tax=Sedimentibacter sp. TaxID=1960295 RepID=UPI003157F443
MFDNGTQQKKNILFITGTRADYGKIKSLIRSVEDSDSFEAYVYVSGMHLLETYGSTYKEVLKDNYKNVYVAFGLVYTQDMSYNLGDLICNLTGYVKNIKPDMIIVHGDRIDALAGAMVGALNNIRVSHIEGGELSGTIDESIRHAISKFSHLHFVSTEDARNRLVQLGEAGDRIFIIGSPDIDIMLSDKLPTIEMAKRRYDINFEQFSLLMYHPVTTEYEKIGQNIKALVDAVIDSDENYIVIYPNNDLGSEVILNEYRRFNNNNRFLIYPSIRFEYFLTLLKSASFMIGNSSAGVRETSVYGIPCIDVGSRQSNRYNPEVIRNIQHVEEKYDDILTAIKQIDNYRVKNKIFGNGNSTEHFIKTIENEEIWKLPIQKNFVDLDW